MINTKRTATQGNCFKLRPPGRKMVFSSPLVLKLAGGIVGALDPIDAILSCAQRLQQISGIKEPPFSPTLYAPFCGVKEIRYENTLIDGSLIPYPDGFVVELRKDRPVERQNFTLAHELGHTFFYEYAPSQKYRDEKAVKAHEDKEEEMLCNVAAAELLMPSKAFSLAARSFPASPTSLRQIAKVFGTSLQATAIRLAHPVLWNATFVLWQKIRDKLVAKWMIRPNVGLLYSPQVEVINELDSGIYNALLTDGPSLSEEWLSFNKTMRYSQIHSLRLSNSQCVLSMVVTKVARQMVPKQPKKSPITLPFQYACECDGTGWRSLKSNGHVYVCRCRAAQHLSPAI